MLLNRIFITDPADTTALVARLALGITIFPHGAQKLLGWFDGYGFQGTMQFLTGSVGLPYIVALLVILIESIGSLMILIGFAARVAALGMLGNFLGAVVSSHAKAGFFMNWYQHPNQPEGLEYFVLLFGLVITILLAGGGRASVDAHLFYRN
ncbi:DoxX family protein [Dyadobacter beijingensis]|nr:DoxX family protein [Dyadobacter beijingensis]